MTTVAQAVTTAITHTYAVDTTPAPASQSLTDTNSGFEAKFGTVPGYVETNEGK